MAIVYRERYIIHTITYIYIYSVESLTPTWYSKKNEEALKGFSESLLLCFGDDARRTLSVFPLLIVGSRASQWSLP